MNQNKLQGFEDIATQEKTFQLADFTERFLAYFIDILPFSIFANITIGYFAKNKILILSNIIEIKIILMWALAYLLYVSIFHSVIGATIGKLILGLRVVDLNANKISFWQALTRGVGYFISSALLYIGFIMALFNEKKRTLHDYLASTVVIRVREKTGFTKTIIFILSFLIMMSLVGYWGYVILQRTGRENIAKITTAKQHLKYIKILQKIHKKRYGYYSDDLNRLAVISGDANLFRKKLLYAFHPENFVIQADKEKYYISAYAKDEGKTLLEISGP